MYYAIMVEGASCYLAGPYEYSGVCDERAQAVEKNSGYFVHYTGHIVYLDGGRPSVHFMDEGGRVK